MIKIGHVEVRKRWINVKEMTGWWKLITLFGLINLNYYVISLNIANCYILLRAPK